MFSIESKEQHYNLIETDIDTYGKGAVRSSTPRITIKFDFCPNTLRKTAETQGPLNWNEKFFKHQNALA